MIKVADIVSDLIESDELALEALRAGFLNLSAYADKIHKKVEEISYKEVQKGTIVVALSRLSKNLSSSPPLITDVKINNLSLKSSLSSLTYIKTPDISRKVSLLSPYVLPVNDLFAVTEGPSEVTLICSDRSKEIVKKHFKTEIKTEYEGLVAVTVEIAAEIAENPNVLYTILASFASKRVKLIDIIITKTEVSFIINKEDMETILKSLNRYFISKPK